MLLTKLVASFVTKVLQEAEKCNMSNLRKHLLTKYPEQYMALQQRGKEQAQAKTELLATCSKKQLTITKCWRVESCMHLTTPEPEF